MLRKWGWVIVLILFSVGLGPFIASVQAQEELDGTFTTLMTSDEKIIARTAHRAFVGDRYLDSEDQLFEVYKISGTTAYCKMVSEKGGLGLVSGAIARITSLLTARTTRPNGPVAIYHTHSAESYLPTDGKSSKEGRGGIIDVGDTLAKAFRKNGIPAVHSDTEHIPHDALAYDRSRRTAVQLLRQKRPSVLLDVHRDAVPREEYATEINGQGVTKIQLVVGRENPNFEASNTFAKQIKKTVNRKYPGFIKGIFYGKGKYNQDLTPKLMLLEFGTNTNSKESAERAADIFAASAKDVFQGTIGLGLTNRGSWRSLFWIVAALAGGVGLFILINRGSLKDIGKEFAGALGEEGGKANEPDRPEGDSSRNDGDPS